jgi:hypothetical protein
MDLVNRVPNAIKKYFNNLSNNKEKNKARTVTNKYLQFKDKSLEHEYLKSMQPYKRNFLIFFQTFSLLWVLLLWLLNPLDLNNYQGSVMGFNIVNIACNIGFLFFVCRKKDFRFSEVALFALQIYLCLGYLETQRKNRVYYQSTNYVITGVTMELVILITFISRCSWIISGLSSFTLNIYLNFRLTENEDNKAMKGLPILVYIANFLLITYGSYMHERYDRLMFYARVKNEENLKRFEQIIKEVLPSSIIVSRGEEIVFYNEETIRLLNIEKGEKIEDHIAKISIREENNYSPMETEDNVKLIEIEAFSNQTIAKCFNEMLKNLMIKNIDKGFSKFSGVYESAAESINKSIEIKLGKISWEGTDAVIAILTEDYAAQKLTYLREQARYKDRLLATVSHDLRTPLNGIIGILDTTLEEVSDEKNISLKKMYFLKKKRN